MPFGDDEKCAVQAQALRAIVATNSPETLFENPEMLKLFAMLRKESPAVILTARVVGGRLLNDAAEKANDKLKRVMKIRELGLVQDGWKSRKKDSLNGLCTNVDFKYTISDGPKTYPIDIMDERQTTRMALPNFQLQLGDYFKVYTFGAKVAEEATFLIGWLNNHGK
ncbi:hypothetical protein BT96DRAFT_948946, partial [Gymnopus androsaceus JB14]